MLRAVDADTHIFESPQVWDFMYEQMYARRPIIGSARTWTFSLLRSHGHSAPDRRASR